MPEIKYEITEHIGVISRNSQRLDERGQYDFLEWPRSQDRC